MTSPLLARPGAVAPPEDSPDAGVPWHFGDPLAEQRSAARTAVVVDRSHRTVVAVPGEDRLGWLHTLLSQHVTDLPEGAGTEALVLDGNGRIDAHMVLAHLDGCVWLDADAGATATGALPPAAPVPLAQYLESMRFWSKVEPRDASSEYAVLSLLGPEAPGLLTAVDAPVPAEPYAVAPLPDGGWVRRMPWPRPAGFDLLVPRDALVDRWERLTDAGARPAGSWAYEALRVEALRPRAGLDTDNRTIPHEVGWIGVAVHLEKGCYRGQETVARVHNLGRPPRRMVLLHLDGSPEVQPVTGDPVTLDGKPVGRVGSVALHHELGPIALALLKRSAPLDAQLVAGAEDRAVAAAVDPDSVPTETGQPPGRQALRRLHG
ncbi:glycine cleavage system protein T [Longimycelium tulufanense]|uniref:Glycine cleavage system protein T n=1 Tax=Longimycelium tulufanense TaxID=907463 RepID=A0A8J3CGR2_9PSEU|nr:folate-binding protein YgfZ [Longimycelium tulufanense]GGM73237.1 glycine cleavage system protein T [Longimycelium tulufanense]